MKNRLIHSFAGAALAAGLAATPACAQAPPAEAQSPLAPQRQAASQFTPQRLEQMLAPIALYPDELLGDILMAATYPLDVVKAARWVQDPRNASLKGDQLVAALKDQDWDPSVKSLAAFPRIVHMMDANLEWTERLGEAFLADPASVMDAVQRLRRRAQSAGRLYSTPQSLVGTTEEAITIEAPSPEIVYVPACDPSIAYGAWPYPAYPPYAFPTFFSVGGCGWVSAPIIAPLFGLQRLNFHKHRIEIDRDRFAKLNRDRAPSGEEWLHDPSHRGNVPYRDAAVAARYGGATERHEIGPASRDYSTGPPPRAGGSFMRMGREGARVPPTDGAGPFTRLPVPPVYGPVSQGVEVRVPSGRGFFTRISPPPVTWMGGGHAFSAPIGGHIRTAPAAIGVQAFPGGVRGR